MDTKNRQTFPRIY